MLVRAVPPSDWRPRVEGIRSNLRAESLFCGPALDNRATETGSSALAKGLSLQRTYDRATMGTLPAQRDEGGRRNATQGSGYPGYRA